MCIDFFPKDVQHALAQLVCLNGMQTNADVPGVEKVVCSVMKPRWKTTQGPDLADLELDNRVPPDSLFMVKGWNRSVSCLAVLMAAYEHPVLYEAIISYMSNKESLGGSLDLGPPTQ